MINRYKIPLPREKSELRTWKAAKQRPIQRHVIEILLKWLREFWYDKEDCTVIEPLRLTISTLIRKDYPEDAERLLDNCVEREFLHARSPSLSRLSLNASPPIVSPTSQVGSNKSSSIAMSPRVLKKLKNFRIHDFEPSEIARQLTLIEAAMYMELNPIDFLFYQPDLNKGQKKDNANQGEKEKNHIRAMINMANQLTGWVAETILVEKDLKQRAKIMKQFIKIAEQCHQLQNYASREAIIAALNSSPIYRLKRTWEVCFSI